CNFRDQHQAYEDLGAVVIGVSPDPIEKHKKFIDKHDLPFTLLADTDHRLAEAYGVWKLKKMFGKEFHGIERSTFVIDEAGKLLKAFRKVKVKGHADEILDLLKG